MQNEQKYEGPEEEGEYHFSDDSSYDSTAEEGEAKPAAVTEKSSLASKLTSYRRFVIGGAMFAVVLFVAYLIVSPPVTPPPTEISEIASNAPTQPPLPVSVPSPTKMSTLATAVKTTAPASVPKTMPPMASPSTEASAPIVSTQATPSANMQVTAPSQPPISPSPAQVIAPLPPNQVPTVLPPTVEQATMTPSVAAMPATSPQEAQISPANKMIIDRLTALEEENARLIGRLNAEYSHKLAEFESQDKAVEEQMRALSARISSMESEMNQLVQVLNKQNSNNNANNNTDTSITNTFTLPSSSAVPTSKSNANYSVQAIIPGRAWLRAENGETVTVAEGDILKSLGRVTKIDPYDGTIQIDTGSKVITLTYGSGDYA